jgi:predicted aminopeptidase
MTSLPLTAAGAGPRRALLGLLAVVSGCGLGSLATGQLELINGQLRLDRAIEAETDPERKLMLYEVEHVRAFAEETVGLRPGNTYTGYYATEKKGLTYVVTASERLRLEPYRWWFPIAGEVEYRSFWEEPEARIEAGELEDEGFDTWISASRAYSTLGFFRDPVITTMMRNGLPAFVEVLIHEMSHARLYVPGHTDWNEALASFVGERGVERYFAGPRFANTGYPALIEARRLRRREFDRMNVVAGEELERLYASPADDNQKLAARNVIFDRLSRQLRAMYPDDEAETWRMNNARILHFRRYTASNVVLARLWTEARGNFRHFWELAEAHSRTLD